MDGIQIQRTNASYLRNFIFGVEDSLVSTVGLLSGVAAAGTARSTILVTGVVLIFVEAFSMAVGSFLSESSVEEYETKQVMLSRRVVLGGLVMFVSYFVSGFVPLAPYLALTSSAAFWWSIGISLAALFVLGAVGARIAHVSVWRSAVRMAVVGGIAIAVGVTVGNLLQTRI